MNVFGRKDNPHDIGRDYKEPERVTKLGSRLCRRKRKEER